MANIKFDLEVEKSPDYTVYYMNGTAAGKNHTYYGMFEIGIRDGVVVHRLFKPIEIID